MEQQRVIAVAAEREAAQAVATVRRAGASRLAAAVREVVRSLAMPHAEMEITVGSEAPGDDVTFLIAANPGLPLLPLSRVASGGELARTMLALRLVLTEAPETLVFDEVDAGIGGTAATAVAESLARLGRRHQVMCVTHLAQVAALADTQIMVTKTVSSHERHDITTTDARRSTATSASTRSPGCSVASRPATRHVATRQTYSRAGCAFRDVRRRSTSQHLAGREEDDGAAGGVEPVVVGGDDDRQQRQDRVDHTERTHERMPGERPQQRPTPQAQPKCRLGIAANGLAIALAALE